MATLGANISPQPGNTTVPISNGRHFASCVGKLLKDRGVCSLNDEILKIFNNEKIYEDFLYTELTRKTNTNIELDIYIPQLELAFEYQGEHHYFENPKFGSIELQTIRDTEKLKLCQNNRG